VCGIRVGHAPHHSLHFICIFFLFALVFRSAFIPDGRHIHSHPSHPSFLPTRAVSIPNPSQIFPFPSFCSRAIPHCLTILYNHPIHTSLLPLLCVCSVCLSVILVSQSMSVLLSRLSFTVLSVSPFPFQSAVCARSSFVMVIYTAALLPSFPSNSP